MDKVYCPYCGTEMFYFERRTKGYGVMGYYLCRTCESRAPRIENIDIDAADMKAAALTAAMQRWVEPLKPLELHEVTGSEEPCVFLESRGYTPIKACDCVISANVREVDVMMINGREPWVAPMSEYGKSWRCWARCPTDAEREAVAWE